MPALRDSWRARMTRTLFLATLAIAGAWSQHAHAQAAPAMAVSKVLAFNSDNDASGTVTQGDVLHYTVTATNTAGVRLTNVIVSDPLLTPASNTCASVLAKGNTCQLSGSYTVTAADVAAGVISNTGSATSTEITTPVNSNTVNTPVFGSPAMSVKVALASFTDSDLSGNVTPGDTLFYNVTAKNTGNTQLTNVQVNDGSAVPSNCTPVPVGGTCVLSISYVVQAADASVGFVNNTGSATSTEVPGPVTNTLTTPVFASPVLSLVSGNNQIGVVGEQATHPLVVHLLDSKGQPFAGKSVTWQVVSGPAALNAGASFTDSSGNAQIGFSYGATTGAIVMRATFGTASVDFNATSQSYLITILGGNGQTAGPGQSLPQDFVVQVSLPAGLTTLATTQGVHTNALPSLAGVAVQWQVLSGGGTLSLGANTVTDASGHATNHYTLGAAAGLNQVRVTVPGAASVTFSATSANNTALQAVSGNAQTLATNTPSAPLVVLLTNNGVPIPNATITWSATNATLTTPTSVTDATGRASNTVKVTNPGAATVTASSSAPPAGPTTFGLNGGISNIPGLTPQQGQIAHAIDNACPALAARTNLTPAEQDLLTQCQALAFSAGADPAQARDALTEMFSDVAFLQTSAALLISTAQFDNIKARIAALRSGTGGAHFGGLAFNTPDGNLPLGSISDTLLGFADAPKDEKKQEVGSDFDRWGFFASGTFGHGTSDQRQVTPGFGFNTNGITAGVDYRYSDKLIFGISAGYAKYNANLTAGEGGGMDTTGWSLSAYSTFFRQDSWYLDGVLTFGSNNYNINRTIDYTLTTSTGSTTVNQKASASAGGSTFAGALTFGRDFSKGPWSFGPYFRGTYTVMSFDSYQETLQSGAPGNGLGLAIQARDLKSTASVLGAKVNYVSSQSWGVVMPHAEVEWEHEFQDSPDSIVAHFIHDPTATPIEVRSDAIDTDFFRLGLGLSFVFTHGRSGFIYYEKTLGRAGITQDNIAIGLRLEF